MLSDDLMYAEASSGSEEEIVALRKNANSQFGGTTPDSPSIGSGPSSPMMGQSIPLNGTVTRDELERRYDEGALPADKRFLWLFPLHLERRLKWLDDTGIAWCQKLDHRIWFYINMVITATVAIEIGVVAPFILFMVGWDGLATELLYLILILSIVSQIPKRFIWRFRPYMVYRAQMIKKEKTSSFPSRAVTCAVVYGYALVWGLAYNNQLGEIDVTWWMPIVCLVIVLLSSFARINLGVHYPSDCLAGLIQGIIVCVIGTGVWRADILGCSSCHDSKCYASDDEHALTPHQMGHANWYLFGAIIIVSMVVTALAQIKPMEWWTKCDRVLGTLLPPMLFQLFFLCPEASGGYSLSAPGIPQWPSFVLGGGVSVIAMLLGLKFERRFPFVAFLVIYVALSCTLIFWRLYWRHI
eukprot:TRINITY_DN3645_c0_g1_i1.p1 TRINITY_DN3645_c0_g1~~TRINITY_DN3645_c0_g1_i1.p1  ORF type:complete len:412 (+),score=55.92 TRINITY_DN3645_c0_g1_i1:178-1413(+)